MTLQDLINLRVSHFVSVITLSLCDHAHSPRPRRVARMLWRRHAYTVHGPFDVHHVLCIPSCSSRLFLLQQHTDAIRKYRIQLLLIAYLEALQCLPLRVFSVTIGTSTYAACRVLRVYTAYSSCVCDRVLEF